MIKHTERYADHLWYPILVKIGGGHMIVEMLGKQVNDWNDMIRRQHKKETAGHPRGWRV